MASEFPHPLRVSDDTTRLSLDALFGQIPGSGALVNGGVSAKARRVGGGRKSDDLSAHHQTHP